MLDASPKTLVLVRHGQSTLNVARTKTPIFFSSPEDRAPFVGIPDQKVTLSPKGRMEARGTGKGLSGRMASGFEYAYDSGYVRTVETLDLILEELREMDPTQKAVRKHSILIRERETGYTYCMTKPEVEAAFPWFQEYWDTLGPIFARPIGGESVADVIERVQIFLSEMFAETKGKRVLIVLHGRVLAAMRYLLEDWSYSELEAFLTGVSPINCGVTTYERNDKTNTLKLKEYNIPYYREYI